MVRSGGDNTNTILTSLLAAHSGVGTTQFIRLAKGSLVSDPKARKFLDEGLAAGRIERTGSESRGFHHTLKSA
jgi:hypothetical protein